ncbi:hypothetical protein L7F22_043402 [Adiantum nelumboides]|nr:hypothetical protein [Adiantum nelumboides]
MRLVRLKALHFLRLLFAQTKALLGNEVEGAPHGGLHSQSAAISSDELIGDELKTLFDEEKELGLYRYNHNESFRALPLMKKLHVPSHKGIEVLGMSHFLWGKIETNDNQSCHNTYTNSQFEVVITKKKLHHAKKVLRVAFVEFYRGLGLLKSFR